MELLLLFVALAVAAAGVVWWSARATKYRVKNRDVTPREQVTGTRDRRPELDLGKMLD